MIMNTIRNLLIFLSGALIMLGACNRPEEAPEFMGVTNIKVSRVENTTAHLNGDALFHNPNNVKMVLRKIDVKVSLEGKQVGNIDQNTKIKIPAESDFTVPLDASFDIGEVGVLNSLLGMLGGKTMQVHYEGHVRVTMHGIPFRIPVDYEDDIKLR